MKKKFFSLAFMLIGLFSFANNTVNDIEIPKISKFEISNIEVFIPENGDFRKTRYKRINCKDGGFSFFVPFYEQNDLLTTKVSSIKTNSDIQLNIKGEKELLEVLICDVKVSDDKTKVTFNVKKNNLIFPSTLTGTNLSENYIIDYFFNLNQTSLVSSEACPVCAVIAIIAIADACTSAQEACSPCNGTLTVSLCNCSCTPISSGGGKK